MQYWQPLQTSEHKTDSIVKKNLFLNEFLTASSLWETNGVPFLDPKNNRLNKYILHSVETIYQPSEQSLKTCQITHFQGYQGYFNFWDLLHADISLHHWHTHYLENCKSASKAKGTNLTAANGFISFATNLIVKWNRCQVAGCVKMSGQVWRSSKNVN